MVKVVASSTVAIKPGDNIISINGKKIEDVLDLYFYTADKRFLTIILNRKGKKGILKLRRNATAESLPFKMAEPAYLRCQNRCSFCFIKGLPEGLRKELYFNDDDYRLSFLYGNFITLTNVGDRALQRITNLRLSPLYVSIHTTNPKLRKHLFGTPRAVEIFSKIEKLINSNIILHGQIVVIPGLNDNLELDRTIEELFKFYPNFASVGIVPVGLTRYSKVKYRPVSHNYALKIINHITGWQRIFKKMVNKNFVYLADEFYLKAGLPLPQKNYYDDFVQLGNGIGMGRIFLDQIKNIKSLKKSRGKFLFITGEASRPLIARLVKKLDSRSIELKVVPNKFFGPRVTVAGLLVGQDIKPNIGKRYDQIFLPPNCVNDADKFLDDYKISDLGNNVMVAPESLKELRKCLT